MQKHLCRGGGATVDSARGDTSDGGGCSKVNFQHSESSASKFPGKPTAGLFG